MRPRLRRLTRTTKPGRTPVASLEGDRDRDIEDLDAMRRLLTLYIPIMALCPIIASAIYFMSN